MTKTSFIFVNLKIFSVVKRMNERINPRWSIIKNLVLTISIPRCTYNKNIT